MTGPASPPDRLFRMDSEAEKAIGLLRFLAGGVACTGAVAMVWSSPSALGYFVAGVCALIGLALIRAATRARRRVDKGDAYFLRLTDKTLEVSEDTKRTTIPWEEISSIEVDQDRLVIVVAQTNGERLSLEPRYPNISIDDLAHAIAEHRTLALAAATVP